MQRNNRLYLEHPGRDIAEQLGDSGAVASVVQEEPPSPSIASPRIEELQDRLYTEAGRAYRAETVRNILRYIREHPDAQNVQRLKRVGRTERGRVILEDIMPGEIASQLVTYLPTHAY